MAYTIEDALRDPLLAASDPQVLTAGPLSRTEVRWAHASEKLDIAPLLQGGELLLTEAANLGEDDELAKGLAYVDSLVAVGVAAIVVELTPSFGSVPPALVERAAEGGLAVIALHRRVPFVQICQSINTRLSELSFQQIQMADKLSTSLTSTAAAGTVDELLRLIAAETGADVALLSVEGEILGRSTRPASSAASAPVAAFSVALEAAGTPLGSLVLTAGVTADIQTIAAALDRAPAPLSVRLIQDRPATRHERLSVELFALLLEKPGRAMSTRALQLEVFLDQLGIGPDAQFLALAAEVEADVETTIALRAAALDVAPGALASLRDDELLLILPFEAGGDIEIARDALLDRFTSLVPAHLTVCVGDAGARSDRLARDLSIVRSAGTWRGSNPSPVVDARDFRLRRLQLALEASTPAGDFVDDVLGPLLREAPELLETLGTYAASWGHKTTTAQRLGIGRQALYDRLAKIEAIIGPLASTPSQSAALLAATMLAYDETQGPRRKVFRRATGRRGPR